MKAIVSDGEVLRHLQPSTVEAYLQATGWQERSRVPNKVSVWTRDTFSEDKLKVFVPADRSFDDYSRQMYELMETLEKAENRSQLDIISDLITTAPNSQIQGVVMQIQSPEDKTIGSVTLFGVVVDKLRKIYLHLEEPEYALAVKAYQERLPVICKGDLVKEGDTFILRNPRYFVIDKAWQN